MLDFLSRLEKLLPVPDIQQVLEPACKAEHSVKLLCRTYRIQQSILTNLKLIVNFFI